MISIIVSTYNREQYIIQCLESIAKQNRSTKDWELVIVNNNCTDSTERLIQDFLSLYQDKINVSYHIEKSQGLSYARNRGIKESQGDFLVFVDDDAFLDENYIEGLYGYLSKYNDKYIAFGGRIKPYLESELPSWMSPYLMPLMSVIDWGDEVKEFKQNKYPIGANMGFSKALIEEVGDFNVNLGRVGKNTMGGEEKDLFFRIRKVRAKVYYFPKVLVQHVVPDARLTPGFIKKLAIGIGSSEKVRALSISSMTYFKSILIEGWKWGGTFVLALGYLFTFSPSKSVMLFKFRSWVSKGLIN